MKRIIMRIAILACIIPSVLAIALELPTIPPIPKKFINIEVIRPDSNVPEEIASFVGDWEGVISASEPFRKVRMIVYQVSPQKIKFLYGCGDNPFNSKHPGGWWRYESKLTFKGGKYWFTRKLASGSFAHYYLDKGILRGTESPGAGKSDFVYTLEKHN